MRWILRDFLVENTYKILIKQSHSTQILETIYNLPKLFSSSAEQDTYQIHSLMSINMQTSVLCCSFVHIVVRRHYQLLTGNRLLFFKLIHGIYIYMMIDSCFFTQIKRCVYYYKKAIDFTFFFFCFFNIFFYNIFFILPFFLLIFTLLIVTLYESFSMLL
jgi:hypothetical protein